MTRHTSDAARIARSVKGIKDDLEDLEADVRGRDDPVHVLRQPRLAARTFVHGCSVRVYHAGDVVSSGWDDLSRQEKRAETFDASPDRIITRDYRTTTDAYHDWLATAMGRDGATPATDFHFGDGNPSTHSSSDSELQNSVGTIPVAAGVFSGGHRSQGAATLSTLIDYDELEGETLREVGLEAAASDNLLALAGFDADYEKAGDEVVTLDFNLGIEDTGGPDGVLTDGFALWAGLLLTPTGASRGPILTADIGTGDPDVHRGRENLVAWSDQVPITDAALFDTAATVGEDTPSELSIIAYVDAAVAVGDELTEIGLVTDPGPVTDAEAMVTYAEISPTVERTTLENLSLETIIELEHL